MSEFLHSINLTYPQFRAEQGPVPIVSNMEQLKEIVELRVKPGLDTLYDDFKSNPNVAYAGYSLSTYLHPQQRPEFKYPGAIAELRGALSAMGLTVNRNPGINSQDFHVELGDCFDICSLTQNYRPHREAVYKQEYFKQIGHILGPIIRLYADLSTLGGDAYNQPNNLSFSTRHAVFIPGDVLLAGLYDVEPKLREGFAIAVGQPPEYLTTTFDLQPRNTSYQDAIHKARES